MTRPRIRKIVMKKGTKKTASAGSDKPAAAPKKKSKAAPAKKAAVKRKGLRRNDAATADDESEVLEVSRKVRRVKRATETAPTRKIRQPGVIKRLSDNAAYSLAVQDRLNGTAGDNNMINGQGASGFSHLVMPLPLVLQLTLQVSGMPYSAVVEVAGDKGSRKSSFILGLAQIINGGTYINPDYSGWCDYISVETKFPDTLCNSINGYPDELRIVRPDALSPVMPYRCDDMNEWQALIQSRVKQYKKTVDPKRQIPMLIAIDSLTAKLLKESYLVIEREGFAGRAFSVEAASIKRFIGKAAKDIEDHPIILLAVNHVARDKEPGKFQETRRKPGGRFMSYQETFDLDLKAVGKTAKRNSPPGYKYPYVHTDTVRLTVEKSSAGETGPRCLLYVDYTNSNQLILNNGDVVEFDGKARKRTIWCWGRALCQLLSNDNKDIGTKHRRLLDSVCKVQKVSPLTYKCEQISSSVMDGEELGKLISQDRKIASALYEMYSVTEYPVFIPYTNYNELRTGIKVKNANKEFEDYEDDEE